MTQQLLDKIASLKDALRQEQERRINAERRLIEVERIKAEHARKFGELQKQVERGETKSAEIAQYKRGLNRGNNKR